MANPIKIKLDPATNSRYKQSIDG